jgi:hypothetical protein
VVRQRSAKPPSPGSNPGAAFNKIKYFRAWKPFFVGRKRSGFPSLKRFLGLFWVVWIKNWGKTGVKM